jgi:hypothetical protein
MFAVAIAALNVPNRTSAQPRLSPSTTEQQLDSERRLPPVNVQEPTIRLGNSQRTYIPQRAGCRPEQGVLWSQAGEWSCIDLPESLNAQRGPAARVWIGPNVSAGELDSASRGLFRTQTFVLNPGSESALVSCMVFARDGRLDTKVGTSVRVGPGSQGYCRDRPGNGWMLVMSNVPVIPFSYTFKQSQDTSREIVNPWYSVDCENSLKDNDFACRFVR